MGRTITDLLAYCLGNQWCEQYAVSVRPKRSEDGRPSQTANDGGMVWRGRPEANIEAFETGLVEHGEEFSGIAEEVSDTASFRPDIKTALKRTGPNDDLAIRSRNDITRSSFN